MKHPATTFDKADLLAAVQAYQPIDDEDFRNLQQLVTFLSTTTDFYRRSHLAGHVTASAWVMDNNFEFVLLNHHAALDRWMQLGGHIEEDPNIRSAALREATEESGLRTLQFATNDILDIDIHTIPQSPKAPEHQHYDIRFFLKADKEEPISITSESKSLVWVPVEEVSKYTSERSVLRMLEKALGVIGNSK